jgi:predicted site-specific integrase-resolvase
MAEGLLRHDAGDRFEVESAGTKPSQVRPEAIAVMKELGVDISGHRKKEEAVAALLAHRSVDEAAKVIGIAPKTLRRWQPALHSSLA